MKINISQLTLFLGPKCPIFNATKACTLDSRSTKLFHKVTPQKIIQKLAKLRNCFETLIVSSLYAGERMTEETEFDDPIYLFLIIERFSVPTFYHP